MWINASKDILRPESETFNFVLWLADINRFGGRGFGIVGQSQWKVYGNFILGEPMEIIMRFTGLDLDKELLFRCRCCLKMYCYSLSEISAPFWALCVILV